MITLSVDDQSEVTELMRRMLVHIDPAGQHATASGMEEALALLSDDTQILFLDIEMPGINGIEVAERLQKQYQRLNIIFVTGHPEYSFAAYGVHPSGFLAKPVSEQDIRWELRHLRFPIETECPLRVRCSPFALFVGDKPFDFHSDRTMELFAYLVYKNGAFCTNGELLGILWDGNPDRSGRLRQLVMDMRASLCSVGAEQVIVKKYGKIGLDMRLLRCEGAPESIAEEFGWYAIE